MGSIYECMFKFVYVCVYFQNIIYKMYVVYFRLSADFSLNNFLYLQKKRNFIVKGLSINCLFGLHYLLDIQSTIFKKNSKKCQQSIQIYVQFFFSFQGHTQGRKMFPGQGLNWSQSHWLSHSHSNAGSQLHLQPTPQIKATPDP